jgi:hypothetical protein
MDQSENPENQKVPEHIRDIQTLSRTELREKYKLTYDSWRNGKQRSKASGNWSVEFDDFTDFLRHMGPRNSEDETLDRINHRNYFYGPGLCRWLDKRGQASNRSTTRTVAIAGLEQPLSEAARAAGQRPETVRKRIDRGWPESEALSGERLTSEINFGRDPRVFKPWPNPTTNLNAAQEWENMYLDAGGHEWGTRYDFLIGTLRTQILTLDSWLERHYGVDTPDIEAERDRKVVLRDRFEREFDRAAAEKPLWEKAVRRFQAKQSEDFALGPRTKARRTSDED